MMVELNQRVMVSNVFATLLDFLFDFAVLMASKTESMIQTSFNASNVTFDKRHGGWT
jgi:hypothetical protein